MTPEFYRLLSKNKTPVKTPGLVYEMGHPEVAFLTQLNNQDQLIS